jgi:hypothetical protein
MKTGFVTQDHYAAIPFGKNKLIIIYDGQQLEVVNTELQAKKFIDKHRTTPGIGTVFIDSGEPPVKMKRTKKPK